LEIEGQTVTDWRLIRRTAFGCTLFLATLTGIAFLMPQRQMPASEDSTPPRRAVPAAIKPRPVPLAQKTPPVEPPPTLTEETTAAVASPHIEKLHAPRALPVPERLPMPKLLAETAAAVARGSVAAAPPAAAADPVDLFPFTFKRRNLLDEKQLAAAVRKASTEIDVDRVAGTSKRLLNRSDKAEEKMPTVLEIVAERADLRGLPLLQAKACQLDKESAKMLDRLSFGLRRALARDESLKQMEECLEAQMNDAAYRFQSRHSLREVPVVSFRTFLPRDGRIQLFAWASERKRSEPAETGQDSNFSAWDPQLAPLLAQVLQDQSVEQRKRLVRLLSLDLTPEATLALAQRALYDFAAKVREQAVLALADRPIRTISKSCSTGCAIRGRLSPTTPRKLWWRSATGKRFPR
jgi:hypothetical protein